MTGIMLRRVTGNSPITNYRILHKPPSKDQMVSQRRRAERSQPAEHAFSGDALEALISVLPPASDTAY